MTAVATRPSRAANRGTWPSHGFDLCQTRFNSHETRLAPHTVGELRLRWELDLRGGVTGTPAVVHDRVVVGSWDGGVYAVDRRSGAVLWRFEAGTRRYPPDRSLGIHASPAISGSRVYLASDRLFALSLADGRLLWERPLGDPATSLEYFWAPPLVHRGRVYAGVSAGSETRTPGRIVCLDAATGSVVWTFATVAPEVAGGTLVAPPSLDAATGTLYAVTGNPFHPVPGALDHSESLLALDAGTGELRWADSVHPHDTRNLDLNCPPMLLEAAGRPLVVAGGKDGVRAWDRRTRERLWHVQLTPALPPGGNEALPTTGPEGGPLAAAGGVVFFASNNHPERSALLAALDAASGEIRWLRCLPAYEFAPMSVANGVVFLGLADGRLRAFSATDGTTLWESTPTQPIAGGPAIAGGMVFVGTGAGPFLPGNRLLAFALPEEPPR